MTLIYNATFDKNTRKLAFEDKAGNEIYSFIVPERVPAVDDITKPLTFKATQDGSTVNLREDGSPSGAFQTSRDGGNTWTDYTIGTDITLNIGEKVAFRTSADRTSAQDYRNYFYFMMEGKIEAWHNVMSLYRTNDFATYNTVVGYAFYYMFKGCTSLTKAPVLPATTLADSCCQFMFYGCRSLTEAPVLPATTLADYCYSRMFDGCIGLIKAPELPATTLASRCYQFMFNGCTSLIKAPELPATTLDISCYQSMFQGCTSLKKAPELPATTLAGSCYFSMFNVCSSLNEVHCKIPSSYSSSQISSSYAKDWLRNVSSTGTFYTNADANWPSGESGIPTGWTRVPKPAPSVDDITKPLTLKATQDGSTVALKKNGSPTGSFQTSRDGGNTWTDYTLDTAITLNTGDEVSFRAKADRTSEHEEYNYFYFMMEGKIEAWHNVMSMLRTNDFATYDTTVSLAFYRLFKGCTSLTKAPVLPATTLAQSCYGYMFEGCTSLTKAPVLPATTLAQSCYFNMFNGCTSLTEAPELPATGLVPQCYYWMFYGCTSLTKAPALPATTLVERCYTDMFSGCTSLVNAPELPATTLAPSCYNSMFNGCTSLTKAPELPATTLANRCYNSMFQGCTSLTKAPELPATTLAQYCYQKMFYGCSSLNEVRCQVPSTISAEDIPTYTGTGEYAWLSGVSSTGTFYTNADANWPSGTSGIPTSWTRVNEVAPSADDITKPLTFKATQDGSTVKLTKAGTPTGDFQTSTDGGSTWTDYTIGTAATLNTGDEVSFRAKSDRSAQTESSYFYFEMTGEIEAWHNVMSMLRTNDFSTYESVVDYAFYRLFENCTSLTKAPVLPATTLVKHCYRRMFKGCTSLTKAPVLPATDFLDNAASIDASNCYDSMFYGCTSLTEAPELPATRINIKCYYNMFYDCTSLTEAPELPATILEESCYEGMFSGCASLTKAPELPATTLAFYCYSGMFNYCTSLVNAPALPATTLKQRCYDWMFARCTSLTKSPNLSATKLASECYSNMFNGCGSLNEVRCTIPSSYSSSQISTYANNWLYRVSSTGTFYTNADANWPSGENGIPHNWTRSNI